MIYTNKYLLLVIIFISQISINPASAITLSEAIAQSKQITAPVGKKNPNSYGISPSRVKEPHTTVPKQQILVYKGSGNIRIYEVGYYIVDTNASGNRMTSTIYVPSLSGTYYGTSGTVSNSAIGVRVVNGVIMGYGRHSNPVILSVYKVG